jgi:hypothetical protein
MDLRIHGRPGEQGQATIMVTLSLLAMCGLMGLAVDLGWAFYVRRSAQAAADAAALGATRAALQSTSVNIDCVTMGCPTTPVSCDQVTAANLAVGCSYAQRNGFTPGGHNGHQTVTIQANSGNPATAPGVNSTYWVTVRVTETVPQLFSAVMGHPLATVSARATGAVTSVIVTGSLVLLNRAADGPPSSVGIGTGTDLVVSGNGIVTASGGILMASNSATAGSLSGSARVANTPFTRMRGNGSYTHSGTSVWQNTPTNGYADGSQFADPMRNKGQPPLPSQVLPAVGVPGGVITGGSSSSSPTVLNPGNYYSCDSTCAQATGVPVTLKNGYFTFANGGTGFGNYIFYGGLLTAGNNNVTFGPGRYVIAGTTGGNPAFSLTGTTVLKDGTAAAGVPASDAGEIFIFTDLNYPGLSPQIPSLVQTKAASFSYGSGGFSSQGDPNFNLHGLNQTNPNLPPELQAFAPVVMWQDQGNTHVKYTADGNIDTSCAGSTLDSPCLNSKVSSTSTSPQLNLAASTNARLYGAVYQPRGAWTVLSGAGVNKGPLQIVTGAMTVQGSGTVLLQGLANPLTTLTAALVE